MKGGRAMTQTQQQIEKLRTLQESYNVVADAVENQLPALADKIDNIKLPEIDTTELAKESTLNEVSSKLDNLNVEVDLSEVAKESTLNILSEKLDNLNVEVDLSSVAKQGGNADATNTAILEGIENILARCARYDTATGNLTIENVNITIE